MQSAEHDLRHKLLQAELTNLMDSLDRLEGLTQLDGIWDQVKNAAKDAASKFTKMVKGNTNETQKVYNMLVDSFKGEAKILLPGDNHVNVVYNGKSVDIKQSDNDKWTITVDGKSYYVTLKEMVAEIKTRTKNEVHTGDVFRYSRAIIQCKAGPHVRAF